MTPIPQPLEINFNDLTINDFIVQMQTVADRLEDHPAFKVEVPEYVARPDRLRQMADLLGQARDAASGGDKDRKTERNTLWENSKLAMAITAHHIVMLSLHRNDPSILLNTGFDLKHKSSVKPPTSLLDLIPGIFVKHGSASSAITVTIRRAKQSASVELQMTDQDSPDESAWIGQGMYTRSRVDYKGLEPAKRVHFRVRYHEDGRQGRWSQPVSIIVL